MKRIKILLAALTLRLVFFCGNISVKADTAASDLVEQALREKIFYHYNAAYHQILTLTDGWLYYQNTELDYKLFKMDSMGKNRSVVKTYNIQLFFKI